MREKLLEYQEETEHLYNLEATPAEGTTYRLAARDKERYPGIVCANEAQLAEDGNKPFYTNSTQLPVNYSPDIFELLDLQDELQARYTGGTVQHVFLGEAVADPEAVKGFVRTVCDSYRLPYFTLTPSFSVCPNHGYLVGELAECPECGERCEVYSRSVGYLRPVDQWNDAKRSEFELRSRFNLERPAVAEIEAPPEPTAEPARHGGQLTLSFVE